MDTTQLLEDYFRDSTRVNGSIICVLSAQPGTGETKSVVLPGAVRDRFH